MKKNIASLYPAPFDIQLRHEFNSSIYSRGKLFCYEEAKITSVKNEGSVMFPERSLIMGLKDLKLNPSDINLWILPKPKKVTNESLFLFFSTLIKAYNGDKKKFKHWVRNKIKFVKHHDLHTFSAIGSSGFKNGVYLNIDGGGDEGDKRHFTWGSFKNNKIKEYKNLKGLNSLASFHAFITEFCGFRDQNGKTSGYSGYGKVQPRLKADLEKLLIINRNGIYFKRKRNNITKPNIGNFDCNSYDRVKIFKSEISMTNIFEICQGYLPQDVAITGETVVINSLIKFLKNLKKNFFPNDENIVFSGGLFLNVRINSKIDSSEIFENCFFPMAPSDSGLSLGGILSQNVRIDRSLMSKYGLSPYLGPSFNNDEILKLIKSFGLKFKKMKNIERDVAYQISKGKIVGVFFGKGEFGQRSLGHRSILADPRNKFSKIKLNIKIKKRDWFMPFAPAILSNKFKEFFEIKNPSLYMQKAESISRERIKNIPSAIHIDNTCRAQYVDKKFSPRFWNIINNFYKITNLPIVLNTSFNRHGISTICSPRQALEHLLEGCVDMLYLENYKIALKDNRILNSRSTDDVPEKKLLKTENLNWLKKNKKSMKKTSILKFFNNIKKRYK